MNYRWHTQSGVGCLSGAVNMNVEDCPGCQYKTNLLKSLLDAKCSHLSYELSTGVLLYKASNGIEYEILLFAIEEDGDNFASIYNKTLSESKAEICMEPKRKLKFIKYVDTPAELVEFMLSVHSKL